MHHLSTPNPKSEVLQNPSDSEMWMFQSGKVQADIPRLKKLQILKHFWSQTFHIRDTQPISMNIFYKKESIQNPVTDSQKLETLS